MSHDYRFPFRAFQIDIARQMETPEWIGRIVDYAASLGYNALVLYGEGALEYRSHPECGAEFSMSQRDYSALASRCLSLGMELIPVIPVLGHTRFILENPEYQGMCEQAKARRFIMDIPGNDICVSSAEALSLLEDLIAEYCRLPGGGHVHVGGDESFNFATCPECREAVGRKGRGPLLAEHFNKVNRIVKKHGRKTMIWGDMLLYYPGCVGNLDKDIVICDWFYKPVEHDYEISIYNWRETPSLRMFKEAGLETVICPRSHLDFWSDARNISSLVGRGEANGAKGFLNTVWELGRLPYALCYPSLAYGAERCGAGDPPEPGEFLHSFLVTHFKEVPAGADMAVSALGELGGVRPPVPIANHIKYNDGLEALNKAARVADASEVFAALTPMTEEGGDYQRAAVLVLRRARLYYRCEGLVNAIASARRGGMPLQSKLVDLKEVAALVACQIECEQVEWNRCRPKAQPCAPAEDLKKLAKELELLTAQAASEKTFPDVLLLDLTNNDCALQKVAVFSSVDGGVFTHIASRAHFGPFGRGTLSFPVPSDMAFVKIVVSGLGQLLMNSLRVVGVKGVKRPKAVAACSGGVAGPENILRFDLRPAVFGDYDNERHFINGEPQPEASVVVELYPQERNQY